MRGLAANLRAGMRAALFLPVGEQSLAASPSAMLALLVSAFFASLAADFLRVGWAGEWTLEGLPGALFPLALDVVAAALLAAFSGNAHKLGLAMTLLLAVGVVVGGLAWVCGRGLAMAGMPHGAFDFPGTAPLWTALASAKAMARWLDAQGGRRVAVYASLVLLTALPLAAVQPDASLWSELGEREGAAYDKKYDALTGEDAFYLQPRLLERALAEVRKQRPGQAELFFVGLAGDAEQAVFLKEVRAVGAIMAGRFGTAGHAVTLANNYHAAMDYPLASVTGLRRALRRVGEIMDKEDDILFLFITSHGSRDHNILLDFWPLRFNPLNPQVLRGILDESAIKWRVVVVSACYSGGFVESLRGENTIVITAAAADRSSFGCADENDWTYFGKAFFDEALRHEDDLGLAFGDARAVIARREREENVDTASEPMIAAGPAMVLKWRSFVEGRAQALRLPP